MKKKEKRPLPLKERLFCYYFVKLQNAREAAGRAGYPAATVDRVCYKLLQKEAIRTQIKALAKKDEGLCQARAGLARLAFGSCADAVKLLYMEEVDSQTLEQLDLYNISEIKRDKTRVEIKFFDRQRALEQLLLLENSQSAEDTLPLYKALSKAARSVSNEEIGLLD
jgi:hypothetical protein